MDLRRAANERKKLLELKKILGELTENENSFVLGNENGKIKKKKLLAGTVAEGSSLPVDIQIALLYHTLNSHSLAITQHNMEADYKIHLSQSTILNHRHRVKNAIIQCYGMPKLSRTVKVDKTYFREAQNGSSGTWQILTLKIYPSAKHAHKTDIFVLLRVLTANAI